MQHMLAHDSLDAMVSGVTSPTRSVIGDRILKVNHAGEHGAVCIYSGQIPFARLWNAELAAQLLEFREHERKHRALFASELARRAHPRCRSSWLCALGGAVLGLVTGALGPSAIAATTVAVEAVVLRHLEDQVERLSTIDPIAAGVVSAIVADERQHHDQSAVRANAGRFWPRVLTPVVSASTEIVIWLGMRL
jgi:ubiquinone biosynthesis monooxygenase Coq7